MTKDELLEDEAMRATDNGGFVVALGVSAFVLSLLLFVHVLEHGVPVIG